MDADQESVLLANNAGGEVLVEPTDVGKLKVPVLPLIDGAIFPKSVFPLTLRGEQAETLVAAARQAGGYVAVFQQRSRAGEVDSIDDLHRVGTLSRLTDVRHGEHGTIEAEAVGAIPVRLASVLQWDPHISAEVEPLHREQDDAKTVARLKEQAALLYRQLLERDPSAASRLLPILDEAHNGDELAYLIGSTIPISPQARQSLLELRNTSQRLARVITYLKKALDLGAAPTGSAAIAPEAPHDQASIDLAELEIRIEGAGMSPEAEQVARRELDRLATLTTASPDYNLVRTYLQTLADLPWRPSPEGDVDLGKARTLLDREHYGVADVKNRILEHLAVRKLRSERAHDDSGELVPHTLPSRQPVLCLLGPPGVGKTSLGRSIAAALDRPFVRISLGGVTDEAEIRGHRRTYLGAMPGRIMQSLLRTGSNRPVIMLDELDKIGSGPKGDPAAAVLDVLDLEQQREFVDLYVDVPFDISRIMFIATANTLDGMPDALRDRLEIIRVPGYTEEEKVEIATRHIIPRQMQWHALSKRDIRWSRPAIHEIIRRYTREAGVRQLDREIATLCRRVAAHAAQAGTLTLPARVSSGFVAEVLGPPRFLADEPVQTDQPGVVTGVFWTPVGGDVMHVEAVIMPGNKHLTVTGQLGDVMRESAQAALSYVRSRASVLGIDPTFYERNDIHLHVPSGAVAKDGPSAGITMATALISLLTRTSVPGDIAMTGELTLTGRVLPVGGIKEKVLAARRLGIRTVIMPSQNRRDLEDVQPEALADVAVRFVDTMDDVLDACFPTGRRRAAPLRRVSRRGRAVRPAQDDDRRPEAAASPRRS